MAFNAALLMGQAGGLLGKLMGGGGPLADIEKLSTMAPAISLAAIALNEMATGLNGVAAALNNIDDSKLKNLEEFADSQKPGIAESIGNMIAAPINAIGNLINGGGGEEPSQQEIIDRLDRLIAVTEGGKVIEMDGNKVGKTLALSASEIG